MPAAKKQSKEESSNTPVLVKAYGEFWNPDTVNWAKEELLGRPTPKGQDMNLFGQNGIYVLYNDFQPVYVGKAFKLSIGKRLKSQHENHRRSHRWDRFSWFGFRGFNKDWTMRSLNDGFHPKASELIATIESLLILTIDPQLNARKEQLKNAVHFYQSDVGKPKSPVEVHLTAIEKQIARLSRRIESSKHRTKHTKKFSS
jgi:hypothetical protein